MLVIWLVINKVDLIIRLRYNTSLDAAYVIFIVSISYSNCSLNIVESPLEAQAIRYGVIEGICHYYLLISRPGTIILLFITFLT